MLVYCSVILLHFLFFVFREKKFISPAFGVCVFSCLHCMKNMSRNGLDLKLNPAGLSNTEDLISQSLSEYVLCLLFYEELFLGFKQTIQEAGESQSLSCEQSVCERGIPCEG